MADITVSEAAGTVAVPVTYYGNGSGGHVTFTAYNEDAKAGVDYTFTPYTLDIAAGQVVNFNLYANIINNDVAQGTRSFQIIANDKGRSTYNVHITDDGDTGVKQADGSILGTLKAADESTFEIKAKDVIQGAADGIAKAAGSKYVEDAVVDASGIVNDEYALIQQLSGAETFDSSIDYNLLKLGSVERAAKITGLGVTAYSAIKDAYAVYSDPTSTASDVVKAGAKSLVTALVSGEVGEIAGTLTVTAVVAAGVPALAGVATGVLVGGLVAGFTESYIKGAFSSTGVKAKDATLDDASPSTSDFDPQSVKAPSKVSVVDPALVLDSKPPTVNWTYDPATGAFAWLTPQDPTALATLQTRLGIAANPLNLTIVGDQKADKNDVLYGGSGNDVIDGLSGNDVIFGQAGDDVIHGGDGNDLLDGGAGNDVIYGEAGNDIILGGDGNDQLFGGAGNDTIYGGEGNDYVDGGDGDDVLGQYVASKNDPPNTSNYIILASGNTTFVGGSGKNTIYALTDGQDTVIGGSGQDTIWGNPGHVTVDYSKSASAVNVNGITGGHGGDAEGDTYAKVYNFVGSAFNDRFTGSGTSYGVPWTFSMGAGDDVAEVGSGFMVVDGGLGNDTVVFHGARSEYTITSSVGVNGEVQFTVRDNGPAKDGTATLTSVENLAFKDGTVALGPDAAVRTFGTVSFDARGVPGEIYALYDGLLGRAPDALGAEHWAAALNAGTTVGQLTQALLTSGEGQTHFAPNATNTAFVDQLYQGVLGRKADAAGEQGWVAALNGGASRADVADSFVFSAEHVNRIQPTLSGGVFAADATVSAVARLYYGLLGRAPDLGGLQVQSGAAKAGASLQSLAQSFMKSAEYNGKASVDDATFVTSLYSRSLGRSPDQAGLQGWVGALSHGTSRADVAVGIIESPEAQSYLAGNIERGLRLA